MFDYFDYSHYLAQYATKACRQLFNNNRCSFAYIHSEEHAIKVNQMMTFMT